MKRKIFLCIASVLLLLTCSLSLTAQSALPQLEEPGVTKAVAPVYPLIALAANAGGEVAIEVTIDAAGKVIAVRGVEGHKLLQKVSENAAKRWEFVPAQKSDKRTAILKFIFRIAPTEKETETAFLPPYEIVLNYNPPKFAESIQYDSGHLRSERRRRR